MNRRAVFHRWRSVVSGGVCAAFVLSAAVFSTSGCANAAWERELAGKRQALAGLQERAGALETDLTIKLGELRREEKALSAASGRVEDTRRVLREIEQRRREILDAERRLGEAKARLAEARTRDTAAIATLQADVQRLEKEAVVIDRAVKRTLAWRQQQLLENND